MEFFAKSLIKLRCLSLQVLLVLLSLVFLAIWDGIAAFAENMPKVQNLKITKQMLPHWIDQEKIKAGYLYAKDDTKYAALMHSNGINTVIAKANIRHKNTLEDYRRWARACKNEKLHLFIAYNWQPDPKATVYGSAVYSDGTVGIAPCPRNHEYWQNCLIPFGKIIAELSNEPDMQVDGIFLDYELYGSEGNKKHYGHHTCFCDDCFSSFLHSEGYTGSQIPNIGRGDRNEWLKKKNLLDCYFAYLKKDVESLAKRFEQEIHKINPSLIIGMYPTPNDWVLTENARGFGTIELPMIIFATDSYSGGGYHSIPDGPSKLYKNSGIYSRYVAGFLLRSYDSDRLDENLKAAAEKCGGYWMFKMPMLWDKNEKHKLAWGTSEHYWESIAKANRAIAEFLKNPGTSLTGMEDHLRWQLLYSEAAAHVCHDTELPHVYFRENQQFLIYANQQRNITVILYYHKYPNYPDNLEYTVISPEGKKVLQNQLSSKGKVEISFLPEATGVYMLDVSVDRNKFRVDSSNTPIAILALDWLHTIGRVEQLWFYHDDKDMRFAIMGNGSRSETFRIILNAPDNSMFTGSTTDDENNQLRIEVNHQQVQKGVWGLKVDKTSTGKFEDAYFNFVGFQDLTLSFKPEWIFVRE